MPSMLRFTICALILFGCGYVVMDAFRNFLDLTFVYTYRRRPGIGLGYLLLGIFFCYVATMFVLPNYRYAFVLYY